MTLLNKDQILAVDDLRYEDVEVPEWRGTVRVRMMSGTARDNYEQTIIAQRGKDKDSNLANVRAVLLAYTIVDENGELMFTKDDIVQLGKKGIKGINRVFNVASKLNALSDDDVEDLTGN